MNARAVVAVDGLPRRPFTVATVVHVRRRPGPTGHALEERHGIDETVVPEFAPALALRFSDLDLPHRPAVRRA